MFKINSFDNISVKEKRKIIVVDDVVSLNDCITNLLESIIREKNLNTEVIQCLDGVEILGEVVRDQRNGNLIDFIIIDENMDFMNGSEAIALLRKLEVEKKIRVPNIISSTTDELIQDKLRSLNVKKILGKPISKNSLKNYMKELKLI